jgi:hypothetical protein
MFSCPLMACLRMGLAGADFFVKFAKKPLYDIKKHVVACFLRKKFK